MKPKSESKSKTKTHKVNHIYENYGLYQILYGRNIDYKMMGVTCFSMMLEHLANTHPMFWHGLNICETHAGRSEHRQLMLDNTCVPINSYTSMELIKPKNIKDNPSYVHYGNVISDCLPEKTNIVLSYYFSVNTTLVEGNYRKAIVAMAKNIYKCLPKNGAWLFHFGEIDANGRTLDVAEIDTELYVPGNSVLRKELDLPVRGECYLSYITNRVFNRSTGIQEDWLSTITVSYSGTVVAKYTINKPFTTRFWSEGEIYDILEEAGFNELIPWRHTYNEIISEHYPLHNVIDTNNLSIKDEDNCANHMVAIKL